MSKNRAGEVAEDGKAPCLRDLANKCSEQQSVKSSAIPVRVISRKRRWDVNDAEQLHLILIFFANRVWPMQSASACVRAGRALFQSATAFATLCECFWYERGRYLFGGWSSSTSRWSSSPMILSKVVLGWDSIHCWRSLALPNLAGKDTYSRPLGCFTPVPRRLPFTSFQLVRNAVFLLPLAVG